MIRRSLVAMLVVVGLSAACDDSADPGLSAVDAPTDRPNAAVLSTWEEVSGLIASDVVAQPWYVGHGASVFEGVIDIDVWVRGTDSAELRTRCDELYGLLAPLLGEADHEVTVHEESDALIPIDCSS